MFNKRVIGVALLASVFISMSASASNDEHENACDGTADMMLRACGNDVRDDFYTTIANCMNISNRAARRQCKVDAKATRQEESENCDDIFDARMDACEVLDEDRYDPDPLLDPAINYIHPDQVPDEYPANPYFTLAAGRTYVVRAGEDFEETNVVTVTEETRDVQGVDCRVVADVVLEVGEDEGEVEYEGIEATDDLYAQDDIGNVYYCGEISREFEDGVLRELEGSFESGREYAKSGILIRAFPVVGNADRQEFSLGEAEDIVEYVDLATGPSEAEGGDGPEFPCGTTACQKTFEYGPLEPDASEFKYYLPGTGFVLGVSMEDEQVTGERDELLCAGDSLDVLDDAACGIDDVEALLDELCKLSPDAFCED